MRRGQLTALKRPPSSFPPPAAQLRGRKKGGSWQRRGRKKGICSAERGEEGKLLDGEGGRRGAAGGPGSGGHLLDLAAGHLTWCAVC
jgi:hypothetical protein